MRKKTVIGLTGGVASGKSLVLGEFRKAGVKVLDADRTARQVLAGERVRNRVLDAFGAGIMSRGRIDRKKLASVIFGDASKRSKLNGIMHPLIIGEIKKRIKAFRRGRGRMLVVDAPLLFEARMRSMFDVVVVVWVPRGVQLKRLMKRDGVPRKTALKMINSQMPLSEKRKRADMVIDNSGGAVSVKREVRMLLSGVD